MGIFDTILIVVLAGFVFYGLFFGLIRTVGSLAGIIIGAFVASQFYLSVYNWGKDFMFGHDQAGKIICFILLFTVANRLVCFGFALLDKALDVIAIIPFVKTINRLTGAILGLVEGSVALGLVFYYAGQFHILDKLFIKLSAGSKIVPFVVKVAKIFISFLPTIIDKIKGWI